LTIADEDQHGLSRPGSEARVVGSKELRVRHSSRRRVDRQDVQTVRKPSSREAEQARSIRSDLRIQAIRREVHELRRRMSRVRDVDRAPGVFSDGDVDLLADHQRWPADTYVENFAPSPGTRAVRTA
jgi:hypothetical protein